MKLSAYVRGFAGLVPEGILTAEGIAPWEVDQKGAADVKRSQVYQKPHAGFGKLQPTDKIAFGAASLACRSAGEFDGRSTGVCLGSAFGSFSTDMRYMESVLSGFPRPAWFSATLPSSPVAETAIMFGLKGPNRVFVDSGTPGLTALEASLRILKHGAVENMLAVMVRALHESDAPFAGHITTPPATVGFALFLSRNAKNVSPLLIMEGEIHDSNGNVEHAKSYFGDIMKALMQARNTTIRIDTSRFDGTVTVQKEE